MPTDAKRSLDKVLIKSRVHFYKPIQIAEILYHQRVGDLSDLKDIESYRGISKRWRDLISKRLVGRVSTSSARFQDNVFEANATPPEVLSDLGKTNLKNDGLVEAYIYLTMRNKFSVVRDIKKYLETATPETFRLEHFVDMFESRTGLKRSMDKVYEITVYALFSTLVRKLNAQVTLEIMNQDRAVLEDFGDFVRTVLGLDSNKTKLTIPAALYRVGVTNAADRGLDMWANFGTAVQVKHLTLNPSIVEDIAENILSDSIVIVCLDSESQAINNLLSQVGWAEKIRGIITLRDLSNWYRLSLSKKYQDELGKNLIKDLLREFDLEFPSNSEIDPFLHERGYDRIKLPNDWAVTDNDG